MTYDKPITIQRQDPDSEEWKDYLKLHAIVNKAMSGTAYTAGTEQRQVVLNFDVRFISKLEEMQFDLQPYRIIYRGHYFRLADYDDYFEGHQTVRLTGELYG